MPPLRATKTARVVKGEDGVWDATYTYDDEAPTKRLVRLDVGTEQCGFFEIDPRYDDLDLAEYLVAGIQQTYPTIAGRMVAVDSTEKRLHLRFEPIGYEVDGGIAEARRVTELNLGKQRQPVGFAAPSTIGATE